MEVYKADLRRFRERTSLLLFCQTQKKRYVEPPSRFQEVVGKFKWPRDVTLEVVEQFRQEYAFHYNLRECAMMLVEVRPGSFVVAWFVPESIVEKLKIKIPEKILEKFATAELTIGGDCIYSSEDAEVNIFTTPTSSYNMYVCICSARAVLAEGSHSQVPHTHVSLTLKHDLTRRALG